MLDCLLAQSLGNASNERPLCIKPRVRRKTLKLPQPTCPLLNGLVAETFSFAIEPLTDCDRHAAIVTHHLVTLLGYFVLYHSIQCTRDEIINSTVFSRVMPYWLALRVQLAMPIFMGRDSCKA